MKKGISKGAIRSIIAAAVIAVVVSALLITNIFIPVKYLSAYIVFSKDGLAAGSSRVTFIDVGYGDCTLVELPDGKVMLIDGGNGRYKNELSILKCLNKRNISAIDYLICTSVKAEHCGGLAEIIKYKTVRNIYMPYCIATQINDGYRKFTSAAQSGAGCVAYCEYGEGAEGEGWSFCFLSPSVHTLDGEDSPYYMLNTDPTDKNINDASAVIWLECGGVCFLFLSDVTSDIADRLIEKHSVNGLLDTNGNPVDISGCDVLKASSHGAECGAYVSFYDVLKPETAIISVGDNGYGAPSAVSVAEIQAYVGEKLFRTDLNGTITVTVKEGGYTLKKEK